MRRTQITFATLLPLLWLAAAVCGPADARGAGTGDSVQTFVSAAAGARNRHDPIRDVCSSRSGMRSLSRRAGMLFDPDPTSMLAVASGGGFSGWRLVRISSPGAQAPAELARSWQFYWRAAAEPRAPSLVS